MPTLADAFRTPPMACPFCGTRMDAASMFARDGEKGERTITPNRDVSLCGYCGEWMVLNQAGSGWRKPSDAEHASIASDKRCQHLRTAWLMSGGSFRREVSGFGSDVMKRRVRE